MIRIGPERKLGADSFRNNALARFGDGAGLSGRLAGRSPVASLTKGLSHPFEIENSAPFQSFAVCLTKICAYIQRVTRPVCHTDYEGGR